MTGRTLDPEKERETRDGSSVSTGTVSESQVPGLPHSDAWPVPRQSERGASLCDPTQPSFLASMSTPIRRPNVVDETMHTNSIGP